MAVLTTDLSTMSLIVLSLQCTGIRHSSSTLTARQGHEGCCSAREG